MNMKKLLFTIAIGLSLCTQAQIHPASIWSMTNFYNAPANHTKEVWTIMTYNYYNITIARDANNYITGCSSSTTPGPLSPDQYQTTGSKVGNVYTATSQRSVKGGAYKEWRRDTWKSDGSNDTLIMWEDYDTLTSTWKNVQRQTLTYSGGLIQTMIGYTWNSSTSVWDKFQKNEVVYSSGKMTRINSFTWNSSTSAWTDNGNIQYFFTGNKLDSMQEWKLDMATSTTTLKYRYIITSDANNKTAAFQQLQYQGSKGVWENSINIAFTNGSSGFDNLNPMEAISVFPVPANEILNINLNQNNLVNATARIFSMDGKEVFNSIVRESNFSLPTSNLSNGMYILLIENNGIKIHQQKMMVSHN